MGPRRTDEDAPIAILQIRTRYVVGPEGTRSVSLSVFCPQRGHSTPIDTCEKCPRLARIDVRDDPRTVRCAPDAPHAPGHEKAGDLVRASVLCVRNDVPAASVASDDRASNVIPVVDSEDHYIGAIVLGRASSRPPPRDEAAAVLRGATLAEDVMDRTAPVKEGDDITTAAARMATGRARSVPVIDEEGRVVGILDDVALLDAVTRARGSSPALKRCSCGREYTREAWSKLAMIGRMRTPDGLFFELRNCEACRSTLALPVA